MLLILHAPREVVDRADTPRAAPPFGRLTHIQHARGAAETVADDAVFFTEAFKTEDVGDESLRQLGVAFPHLRTVEAPHLPLLRNAAAIPRRKPARRYLPRLDERHLESMRIDQRQQTVTEALFDRADRNAVLLETRSPEIETAGGNFQRHLHGKSVPDPRWRHLGPWEEGQIRSRMAVRVGVEQVIGARVVLIH